MTTKEEIAQRLLARCERIEEARKKIDAKVNSQLDEESPTDFESFKEQMEQVRKELVSSQEQARVTQEKYESEISDLRAELDALQVQQKLLATVDENRENEQAELRRNVAEASAVAARAQKWVMEAHDENVRLKRLIQAMKEGNEEEVALFSVAPNTGTPVRREPIEYKAKIFFQNLGIRFKPASPIVQKSHNQRSYSKKVTPVTRNNEAIQKENQKSIGDESSTGSMTDETASIGTSVDTA